MLSHDLPLCGLEFFRVLLHALDHKLLSGLTAPLRLGVNSLTQILGDAPANAVTLWCRCHENGHTYYTNDLYYTYDMYDISPEGDHALNHLDNGIERAVLILRDGGVETFESCEGGEGHAFLEPTVRFHGHRSEGLRALSVALQAGLQVLELRRVWPVLDGEVTGPCWELTFAPNMDRVGVTVPSDRSTHSACKAGARQFRA